MPTPLVSPKQKEIKTQKRWWVVARMKISFQSSTHRISASANGEPRCNQIHPIGYSIEMPLKVQYKKWGVIIDAVRYAERTIERSAGGCGMSVG